MNQINQTLSYYNTHADSFIQSTLHADMTAAQELFIRELPPHASVLDFGCGSGRDSGVFISLGFSVDAVDGSEEVCREATKLTGIPVKKMLFSELEAESKYDGIWACASILHLPRHELIEVLGRIARALKQGGILYTSFKHGTFEGMRGGRWFTDFTEETLADFWKNVEGLEITRTWITHDVRPGREEEKWINLLAIRV